MQAAGKRWITYPSRCDKFRLWNIADIHLGNCGTERKHLMRDIAAIRDDPYSLWIGGGDYADYIGIKDKRFDPSVLDNDIMVSDLGQLGYVLTKRVKELFEPIKDKCLGLAFGNHEDKYQKTQEQMQLHQWLCTELGVANLGYSAFLDAVFVRSRCSGPTIQPKPPARTVSSSTAAYRIFVHHGTGGATTPGGKLNRLLKFMHDFRADIYFVGHVHDALSKRLPRIGADATCTEIVEHDSIGVVAGSYLRTYTQGITGYGEIKGYSPVPLGATYVEITPDRREMHARV